MLYLSRLDVQVYTDIYTNVLETPGNLGIPIILIDKLAQL